LKPFGADGVFQSSLDQGVLRNTAVRGAGITVFAGGVGLGVQILTTVVLSRLLTPNDFGLVAMVTTFSLLFVNFGLNGFTEAILQRSDLNDALASNLFWINLIVGTLLTMGFWASGSTMARFYHDARVAHVAAGISISIFVTSASVLHLALLKRAMLFSVTSRIDIAARGVSAASAVILSLAGCGYWALVIAAVILPLTQSLGAWFMCRWIPRLPKRVPGTGAMLGFAVNVYGRFSVNYFARNMDNLLVGWRFNAQSLGFYKKAYDLFALSAAQLISPLANIAVAALSRIKSDEVQYKRYLVGALGVTAFIGMGVGAGLTLTGKDIIRVLLGPGWDESGRIFSYFGPGIGIMLVYGTHGWIHLSLGKADRWFRWGIFEFIVTGLLFVLGLHWGPRGVAVAWTVSFWILAIPAFWYAGHPIGLGVRDFVLAIWKYVVASFLTGLVTLSIGNYVFSLVLKSPGILSALLRVSINLIVFATLYLISVIILHGGLDPIVKVCSLLAEMSPWRRFSRETS
jgi:polysaccharide transporter, PST family